MTIDDLINTIAGMGLNNGVKTDLITKLACAKGFLVPPNVNVGQAIQHLNIFLSQVNHWSTHPPSNPGLTPAQATLLTNAAQSIIDLLTYCYP